MSLAAAEPAQRIPTRGGVAARGSWEPWLVGALTLGVLLLHLSQIRQSLFGDELLAYREVVGHSLAGTIRAVRGGVESSPPLFFVLAWASAKLGDPSVWIRLPSIVCGALTVPLVYLLGRETVGRAPALVGATAFALSPFATYYGVEARPYATLAFCVALSSFALLRAVRDGGRSWWALYAVASAAAAYTHYTAIFVLVVQGGWSVWACRTRPREPLAAAGLAVLLYLPWLPEVHGSQLNAYSALEPLNFTNVTADALRIVPGYPYAPLTELPGLIAGAAIGLCLCAGVAAQVRWPGRPGRRGGPGLLAALALASPVGLLLYSLLGTDLWDSRNLYASAPAAALLIGWLLAASDRRTRLVPAALALALLGFGTAQAVSPRYQRPPLREAAQVLDRVAPPPDPVVIVPFYLDLDYVIGVEFRRPHRAIYGLPRHIPRPPAGGSTWILLESPSRHRAGPAPRLPGLRLVGTRRYLDALLPFSLLRYVDASPGGPDRAGHRRVVRPGRRSGP